ncbi:Regulatory protein leu3 [Rhinocladiella similis]
MKAKACTKCRQWKARCEYSEDASEGCTRCKSLKLPCVFDASFKRTSKARSIQMMSSKIQELQQALREATPSNGSSNQSHEHSSDVLVSPNWTSQLPSLTEPSSEGPMNPLVLSQPGAMALGGPTAAYRTNTGVALTYGQVNEHFRTYFARCHQYLPFKMTTRSAEAVYSKCSLLFWVICTTAASWKLRSQLAPAVKTMLAETLHSRPVYVEKVQALLIMAMWPFSVSSVNEDASHYYGCIATQMALQLGLHRPTQTHIHAHGSLESENTRTVDEEVKTTTWLSCFIVNQKLAAICGVPPSIIVDIHLLNAFESKVVNARLSQLCRVYHMSMQANLAIGTNGQTPSGMLEPETRLNMVKVWGEQFATFQAQHLEDMDNVVRTAFLTSRLQMWSFILLDDMLVSPEMLSLVENARQDACDLIELCYSQNLSIVPACVRHAMCYSALVLVKLLRSGYSAESEVLQDSIDRARQALKSTVTSPDDIHRKASETIQKLLYIEDKKLSPQIYTRMGASVVYDLLRIWSEYKYGIVPHQLADDQTIDLEGFDWNFLGMLG